MSNVCAVSTCRNWVKGTKKRADLSLHFFRFPKDPAIRAAWVHKCARKCKFNSDTASICSAHFRLEDYDPSYLVKKTLMPNVRAALRKGAVPSQQLPCQISMVHDNRAEGSHSRATRKKVAEILDVSPALAEGSLPPQQHRTDNPRAEQVKTTQTESKKDHDHAKDHDLRAERREKRERKELVKRLLEQHEAELAAEKATPKPVEPQVEVIELVQKKNRIHRLPKRDTATAAAAPAGVASYEDSVAMAVAVAGIVTGAAVEGGAAVAGASAEPETAADHSDDDHTFADIDIVPDVGSDEEEVVTSYPVEASEDARDDAPRSAPGDVPKSAPKGGVEDTPNVVPKVSLLTVLSDNAPECSPTEKPADAPPVFSVRRKTTKRSDMMLERTKEILRLKLKLRKLEDKCRRVLAVPGAPRPGSPVGEKPASTEERNGEPPPAPAAGGEGDGSEGAAAEAAPAVAGGRSGLSETPLMVLREERGAKLPTILTQLRQHQLSDTMAMFTPSDMTEAQEVNHRLKVQFLTMQTAMLKWAIKNKKIRDAKLKESEQRKQSAQKQLKVVRGARLRELLRLEAAVKEMFTESQMRAITREHGAGVLDKKKFVPHWGEEDLRRVLELRAISSDQVVAHVREKMKIPLPSMTATKQRCKKSPELNEAYKAMLVKSDENQRRCGMCERQVNTIDEVAEAVAALPDADPSPYGMQFVQDVPRPGQEASARQKKRRRVPAPSPTRKRAHQAAPAPNWADTSDSDAELSDPGIWERLQTTAVSWDPDPAAFSAPSPRKQPQYSPFRRAWR